MRVVSQYLIFLIVLYIDISTGSIRNINCPHDENIIKSNFCDYQEIIVMNGIKLKRGDYLCSENDGKTIENHGNNITLQNLFQQFLDNHVMEFNISALMERKITEVPRRRRHNQAFIMVLMGIVIFLMFFVTLGFQFLATISGKTFLMSKLALLLSSINGLKKIASSGVHYGLYQTADPSVYAYERFDRPRASSAI